MLADSEYRRELETDIEPFKALLLGLFLMAVGMSIDFGVLWQYPGQMLAILAGFMGLKLLALYAVAYFMKLPYQQPSDVAQRAAERFRQHNLDLFEKMYPHRTNREKVIAVARQGRLQLEAQMAQEREQMAKQPSGDKADKAL